MGSRLIGRGLLDMVKFNTDILVSKSRKSRERGPLEGPRTHSPGMSLARATLICANQLR